MGKFNSLNLNLEKILAKETIVLMDASFLTKRRNFFRGLYDKTSYKELDEYSLRKNIEIIKKDLEVLNKPKIMVLEETLEELVAFQKIISRKACYFNSMRRFNGELDKESIDNKKRLFEEICLLSLERTKIAKQKIYRPKKTECYEAFLEIVRIITTSEKLKGPKNFPEWYKAKSYRKGPLNLHTDEKIIAALLESMYGKPIAAIGKDYHLKTIFKEVCELLLCKELMPYNHRFSRLAKKKPASLYYYNRHFDKGEIYFFRENLNPGWYLFRTWHFSGRENFKLICPYEEARKKYFIDIEQQEDIANEAGENDKKLRELKARHTIIDNLIKIDKADKQCTF
ncbi:MAG: hypothetical protein ACPLXC_00065 [Candidatus Pacearchaeota archaeon]